MFNWPWFWVPEHVVSTKKLGETRKKSRKEETVETGKLGIGLIKDARHDVGWMEESIGKDTVELIVN